ncbi:MAG: DUF1460 domain-containing protein [Bacteroidales bacterium]|nr:DUF1460 domain-containing protein [Bacteroidales bacterium]
MSMLKSVVMCVLLAGISFCSAAVERGDVRYSQKDVDKFEEVMALTAGDREAPMSELVVKIAKHFLGTPYVAGTLEIEPEQLTVNMAETDCILFVEMCVALALTAKDAEPSFDNYLDNLASLRYRDGIVDGYTSRLHYTSEWIAQGERRGVFKEVTSDCGGRPIAQKFNFMSTHPASYKQLKDSPDDVAKMRRIEQALEAQDYCYIPKADLPRCVKDIRSGDIVAFCSTVAGLDIAHIGIALRDGDTLTFIHASTTAKKVIINPQPLVTYINGVKSQSGLRVIRLTDR